MNVIQNAFLKMVVPLAQVTQRKYGVPASVTIAQAILESSDEKGWGQSELARECNNFFGIKSAHLADPSTYKVFTTHEYVSGNIEGPLSEFCRYDSPAESFDAHARLLATASRYRPAMAVAYAPEAFALQLQICGYSTNPGYARGLMTLVHSYDLEQFDIPPDDPAAAQQLEAA